MGQVSFVEDIQDRLRESYGDLLTLSKELNSKTLDQTIFDRKRLIELLARSKSLIADIESKLVKDLGKQSRDLRTENEKLKSEQKSLKRQMRQIRRENANLKTHLKNTQKVWHEECQQKDKELREVRKMIVSDGISQKI